MVQNKTDSNNKTENTHKGHRTRMREGFFLRGFDGLADHEVLEMLLYFVIPQRDTNKIAHELIDYYGSFSAVLKADRASLTKHKYITDNAACLINMILPLYKRYLENLSLLEPNYTDTESLVEFLRSKYSITENECVYALCFDPQHHLIACRKLNEGDISSSMFDLRKLASVVLETKATSVIISHNHPHGVTLPSREDVAVTESAYKLLRSLKVELSDHIIVSETSFNSMVKMPRFAHIFYGLDPLFPDDEDD
ncbi:MAG: RadC family protein [Clostridia bacterium]|nr:RadC family protein [Clostridia bacterium]